MGLSPLGESAAEEEEVYGVLADDWTSGGDSGGPHHRHVHAHGKQQNPHRQKYPQQHSSFDIPYLDTGEVDEDQGSYLDSYAASTADLSVAHSAAVTRKERRRRAEISIMSSRKGGGMRGLNSRSTLISQREQPADVDGDFKVGSGPFFISRKSHHSVPPMMEEKRKGVGGGGGGAFYPGGVDAATDFQGHFTPTGAPPRRLLYNQPTPPSTGDSSEEGYFGHWGAGKGRTALSEGEGGDYYASRAGSSGGRTPGSLLPSPTALGVGGGEGGGAMNGWGGFFPSSRRETTRAENAVLERKREGSARCTAFPGGAAAPRSRHGALTKPGGNKDIESDMDGGQLAEARKNAAAFVGMSLTERATWLKGTLSELGGALSTQAQMLAVYLTAKSFPFITGFMAQVTSQGGGALAYVQGVASAARNQLTPTGELPRTVSSLVVSGASTIVEGACGFGGESGASAPSLMGAQGDAQSGKRGGGRVRSTGSFQISSSVGVGGLHRGKTNEEGGEELAGEPAPSSLFGSGGKFLANTPPPPPVLTSNPNGAASSSFFGQAAGTEDDSSGGIGFSWPSFLGGGSGGSACGVGGAGGITGLTTTLSEEEEGGRGGYATARSTDSSDAATPIGSTTTALIASAAQFCFSTGSTHPKESNTSPGIAFTAPRSLLYAKSCASAVAPGITPQSTEETSAASGGFHTPLDSSSTPEGGAASAAAKTMPSTSLVDTLFSPQTVARVMATTSTKQGRGMHFPPLSPPSSLKMKISTPSPDARQV